MFYVLFLSNAQKVFQFMFVMQLKLSNSEVGLNGIALWVAIFAQNTF